MSALAASATAPVGETTGFAVATPREQANGAPTPFANPPEFTESQELSNRNSDDALRPESAAEFRTSQTPGESNAFLRFVEHRIVGEELLPSGQIPSFNAQEQLEDQSATIARIIEQFEATLEQIDRIVESQEAENAQRFNELQNPALAPLTQRADDLLKNVIDAASELIDVYSIIEDQTLTSPSRDRLNVVF